MNCETLRKSMAIVSTNGFQWLTTPRLQDATGASHLQQLEVSPLAYGVASSARPAIRRLRRQRNHALHGTRVSDRAAQIESRGVQIIANDQSLEKNNIGTFHQEPAEYRKSALTVGRGKGAFPECASCCCRSSVSSPALCCRCAHPFPPPRSDAGQVYPCVWAKS